MKIIIIILFFSVTSFGQKSYIVTAKSGLIIRNKPDINASKIGKLNFEENVFITKITTGAAFTAENINGYWVKIKAKNGKEGYVFNGFLKPFAKHSIIYSTHRRDNGSHQELKATINNKETVLISFKDQRCFDILEIQDYNNDGYEEVLIETNACGGNCCGNSVLVFSYDGNTFIETEEVGYDFDGIDLHYDRNNVRLIVVDDQNIGAGNTTLCGDEKKAYIFENNKLEVARIEADNMITAITEVRSSDFIKLESEITTKITINYDLDNNGIDDKIIASYWERWGILHNCKIIFNNETLDIEAAIGSPKRIGILESKTNNVNDLVIECDTILKWNGTTYK